MLCRFHNIYKHEEYYLPTFLFDRVDVTFV